MSAVPPSFVRPRLDIQEADAILWIEQATVVFDGFRALNIDAFGVRPNELRVVIGPNGAGKTTLCDVITGKTRLKSGWIRFKGENIETLPDYEIARRGVGRKFQTPAVFASLTAAENLELAAAAHKGVFPALASGRKSPGTEDRIMEVLRSLGLEAVRNVQAQYLSHGQRQALEIATLLISEPTLLLVDEPAAGLSDEETVVMAALLKNLAGRHTLIVIEHDMDFVRALNADVTVMNEGGILAEGSMQVVQQDPSVVEAYLGR